MPLLDVSNSLVRVGNTLVKRTYLGSEIQSLIPSELFVNGEQGVWYDPSDLSTLFQDSAGTLPVTAMEQPVGLMLDKSGRGDHAVQATTTARPVVSARYNLLQDTMFQDATTTRKWTNLGLGVMPTYGTHAAPDGTMTAVTLTTIGGAATCYQSFTVTALPFVISFYARLGGTKPTTSFNVRNATTSTNVSFGGFNNSTGAVSGVGWSRTDVGGGWYRVENTLSTGFSVGDTAAFYIGFTGVFSVVGKSCIVWGSDIRLFVDMLNLPAYQRVTSGADYDTVGFPPYLRFDGVDDWMVTPSINLGATEIQVNAVLKKLTDAGRQMFFEYGDNSVNSLFLDTGVSTVSHTPGPFIRLTSRGTGSLSPGMVDILNVPAPSLQSVFGECSIQNNYTRTWVNGAAYSNALGVQGGTSYANSPLYLGARGGISMFFRGRMYQLMLRFGPPSAAIRNAMIAQGRNARRYF